MKTANANRTIKECSYSLPIGESIKTEYVITIGKLHYERLCFHTLEKAKEFQKFILEKRGVETEIKAIQRVIFSDGLWNRKNYIELKTLKTFKTEA
jgi:hypothetical protein